jgi:hypothetical protein
MPEDHPVIDWDDMTEEDKANALDLLGQLNKLFDKYTERDDSAQISPEKD